MYLSHIGRFRMTIIDGDDVDIIPAKFVWQVRDAMKRSNKLELNVFDLLPHPHCKHRNVFDKKVVKIHIHQ